MPGKTGNAHYCGGIIWHTSRRGRQHIASGGKTSLLGAQSKNGLECSTSGGRYKHCLREISRGDKVFDMCYYYNTLVVEGDL